MNQGQPSHMKYHGAALLLALGLAARGLVAKSSGSHIQHTTTLRFAAPTHFGLLSPFAYTFVCFFPLFPTAFPQRLPTANAKFQKKPRHGHAAALSPSLGLFPHTR